MDTIQKITRGIAFIIVVLIILGISNQAMLVTIQPIILGLLVLMLILYAYTKFKQKNVAGMVTIIMLAVFSVIIYLFR